LVAAKNWLSLPFSLTKLVLASSDVSTPRPSDHLQVASEATMKAQRLLRTLVGAAAVVAPWLLYPAATTAADADKSVLRVVPVGDLKIIDPIWSSSSITLNHANMVYDTLFALNSKLEAKPQMVEAYTVSADGLTYAFTLRPGLKWHDGTPVTAADCVQSLRRWMSKDSRGVLLQGFTASITADNATAFTWRLKEPFGQLPQSLAKIASYPAYMMPERIARTDASVQITDATGSGPYRFDKAQWVPGSKVVYLKNTDYVPRTEPSDMAAGAKLAKVDEVDWISLPDSAVAIAALNRGEVDFIDSPKSDLLPVLRQNPDVVVKVNDPLGVMYIIRPNFLHPPFNNQKAREALLYMVDQTEYMQAVGGDPELWRTCDSMMFCGSPSYSNTGKIKLAQKPDFEKAKQLFAEAGYKGEPVVIPYPVDAVYAPVVLVTAQNLKKLGINVSLEPMDLSTYSQRRESKNEPGKGGWSLIHSYWEGTLINPIDYPVISAACEKAWIGWPCNADIERLRLAWAKEADPAKQKQILDELHSRLVDEVMLVPLGQRATVVAFRKNVEGVIPSPVLLLWNISKS
jgi:peptide/nickel transport system substrate-binding protein